MWTSGEKNGSDWQWANKSMSSWFPWDATLSIPRPQGGADRTRAILSKPEDGPYLDDVSEFEDGIPLCEAASQVMGK